MLWRHVSLHNRLICLHNIDYVYTDEHRKTILCSFSYAVLLVGRSRDRFPVVSLDFSVMPFLPTEPWPWGSNQPLVKMSTRNIPGGKGGRCVRLTTYHHTVPLSRNLGALTSQNPLGLFRPVMGQL